MSTHLLVKQIHVLRLSYRIQSFAPEIVDNLGESLNVREFFISTRFLYTYCRTFYIEVHPQHSPHFIGMCS